MNAPTTINKPSAKNLLAITTLTCVGMLLAGCQPTLSFEKQYTLTPAKIMTLPIDPVGAEQTIHVSAISNDDAQFSVHVYLAKNEEAAESAITTKAASDLILDAATKTTTANLSARIPANEESVVRISADSSSVTVNVAINN